MSLYEKFAGVYHRGPYPAFALRMAEVLPVVLERFDCHPTRLLDIACGEGSFSAAMAHRGLHVTGLDRSKQMLAFGRQRSQTERLDIDWVEGNLRHLPFSSSFDLVTCWFDSLNYLLECEHLRQAFTGVQRALKPGGVFIFDMNTIYGLAVGWTRQAIYVQQDYPDLLELHRTQFDYDRLLARVTVTAFERQGDTWMRFDEEHLEKGYPVEEILSELENSGLQALGSFGNFLEMSEVKPESGRAYFVAQKGD